MLQHLTLWWWCWQCVCNFKRKWIQRERSLASTHFWRAAPQWWWCVSSGRGIITRQMQHEFRCCTRVYVPTITGRVHGLCARIHSLSEWVSALHFCASEIFSRCARAVAIRKFLSHRELSALLVIQMNYNIYAHSECAHVYTPSDLHCFGVSVFETLVRYSHKDALLWAAAANSQRDARNFNLGSLAAVVVGDAQVEIILVPTVWKVWLVFLIFKILRET